MWILAAKTKARVGRQTMQMAEASGRGEHEKKTHGTLNLQTDKRAAPLRSAGALGSVQLNTTIRVDSGQIY